MNKITILCGLPSSGKSTNGKKILNESEKCVIVEADRIRMMLTGCDNKYGAFDRANEKLVWRIHKECIIKAINDRRNIIVSDTNLNVKKNGKSCSILQGS